MHRNWPLPPAEHALVQMLPQSKTPLCRSYAFRTNQPQLRKAFRASKPPQRCVLCQASSGTLSKPSSGYLSNSFADQDIFLIAGAGIAGLAMAAALTKVGSLLTQFLTLTVEKDVLTRSCWGHRLGFPVESWKGKLGFARKAVQLAYGQMHSGHLMLLGLQTYSGSSIR